MDYLNYTSKHEVLSGTVLQIPYDKKTVLYARLIEPCGDLATFLAPNGRSEDVLFIKQRWLIEWVNHKNIPKVPNWCRLFLQWVGFYTTDLLVLDKEGEWSQRMIAGKRTHRDVIYKTGLTWEEYIEDGDVDDTEPIIRMNDTHLGDGNSIF